MQVFQLSLIFYLGRSMMDVLGVLSGFTPLPSPHQRAAPLLKVFNF
jgi:hypothetical protein